MAVGSLRKLFERRTGQADHRPTAEVLEPRILYSADLNPLWQGDGPEAAPAPEVRLVDEQTPVASSIVKREPAGQHEIVFVDARVSNDDALLVALQDRIENGTVELIRLQANEDGLATISATLAERDGIQAVHIITHGASAQTQLGSLQMDAALLEASAAELAGWSLALTADADLFIYGCDVAQGEEGAAFVARLAQITGADVTASNDLTGATALGGDWQFEVQTGAIQSSGAYSALASSAWDGVLATYTVNSTADTNTGSGSSGTLRWAINQANAAGNADTIVFAIPGAGSQTITLTSTLPAITNPLIINGTTQSGWVQGSFMPIVIDGNGVGGKLQFTASADNSVLRGLIVRDMNDDAIEILAGADGVTVAGNWIGQFNSDGSDAGASEANTLSGVRVLAANSVIGGSLAANRNVISGNEIGVLLRDSGTGATVSGNYIGTDITGQTLHGSNDIGIEVMDSASNNTLGGATADRANVIAGYNESAIVIASETNDNIVIRNNIIGVSADRSTLLDSRTSIGSAITISGGGDNAQIIGNLIAGSGQSGISIGRTSASSGTNIWDNTIGTDDSHTLNWGNGEYGIVLGNASSSQIGGTGVSDGNTVAYSGQVTPTAGAGIAVGYGGTSNAVLGNSVFNNAGLGIDLAGGSADGVTANDNNDGDVGTNNFQNFPVLNSATTSGSQVTITGTLNSVLNSYYRIEFFASSSQDATGHGEGQRYLGFVNVPTDGSGNATISATLSASVAVGEYITATATRSDSTYSTFTDTSEFARNIAAVSSTQAAIVVDTTADVVDGDVATLSRLLANRGADGFVSLREAITAANNTPNGSQPDLIGFNLVGSGVQTINILTALPTITNPVVIDGWSEPDYAGSPVVEINGGNLGSSVPGFVLDSASSGSTIRGLTINRFTSHGIDILNSGNHTIQGNWIGLDSTGNAAAGNGDNGIIGSNSSGNLIGGTTAAQRNVISGSTRRGMELFNTTNTVVSGNFIGTNASGTGDVNGSSSNNQQSGVAFFGTSSGNTVGGTSAAARNVISANNWFGVEFLTGSNGNTVAGNYIGTDVTGQIALGNSIGGVSMWSGSPGNTIGGSTVGARNVIASGNVGVLIADGSSNNTVQGNYIGLAADGSGLLGNQTGVYLHNGISTTPVTGNLIGTDGDGNNDAFERNVISGNSIGIMFEDAEVTANTIAGNYIGTDAGGTLNRGNTGSGVRFRNGATSNTVGGTGSADGNLIAHNGSDGIEVENAAITSATFLGNRIDSNSGSGIDLASDGVTANDAGDPDSGPNGLQNTPVLASALVRSGSTTIAGSINTNATTKLRIEFFSSPVGDASGYGEAGVFLGATSVTTDSSGNAHFNTTLSGTAVTLGHVVTATATVDLGGGAFGPTSEFAANVVAVNNLPPADIVFDTDSSVETTVNSYGLSNQNNPGIASFSDGGWIVVWASNGQDGSDYGIYAQRYLADGVKNGDEFRVNSVSTNGQVWARVTTFSDGGFAVVWQEQITGVRAWTEARVFNADGTPATADFALGAGVDAANESYQPNVIALDNNRFVAVWANEVSNATYNVVGRIYDRSGSALGAQFTIGSLVSSVGIYGAKSDVTRLDDGGFAVVWRTHDGTVTGVRARVMNGNGSARSAELTLAGNEVASISALDGGGFVVTYDLSGQLKAAIYDASGAVAVPAFTVNTTVSASRYDSSVMRSDDGFVVAWGSSTGDGSSSAILAQRFSGTGTPIGNEILVNQTVTGGQNSPELAETAGGKIVAVWHSDNVDAASTGIAQRMVTTATPVIAESTANGLRVADVIGVLDPEDTHTFSLVDSAGGRFAINVTTGVITVANGALLDYETSQTHNITVRATDGGGLWRDEVFTITLTNVNEAPINAVPGVQSGSEGSPLSITGVSVNDVDGNIASVQLSVTVGSISVSLAGGALIANGANGSGTLTLTGTQTQVNAALASLSFQLAANSSGSSTLTMLSTDAGGLTDSDNVAISVSAVNDAPVFSNLDGSPAYIEGGAAVVLDNNVTIADVELTGINSFNGATLTLQRNGGANNQDQFHSSGTLSALAEGGALVVGGTTVGTVSTRSGGSLVLTFNANATNALVDSVMQQISYANSSDSPPASVPVSWTFSDGNTGSQGSGGALSASASTTVSMTPVNDAPVVDSASLTLTEGQTVTLGGANFGITDPDSTSFTYTVSGISGGYFQLSSAAGTPVTTFTTADLSGGLVQFVDDGNETAPAFSVRVNDGALDSNTLAATINYTAANDAPVVDSASLTLTEGQTVTLGGANFGITDPDSSTFTYTVSGISGGYFQLSSAAGTPVTTFTTADLAGGLVQFVDDGNETAPAFSVTVNDGALDSNTLAATINYTAANDAPVVDSASLTLTEGQTVTLGGANFGITDPDSASFTYIVSGISGGYFQLSSAAGTPVTTFTTADLSGGLVQFVDDGNETAPAFSVTVNDGALDSNTLAATINYTGANDAPVVDSASLTLTEGQTVTLGGTNFGITDPDSSTFTYTVSGVSGGYFQLSSAAGTPVTTFTTADLSGGLVQFVDDGNETAPAFSVTVNDGALDSNTLAATINYTAANDAPVVDSASLTLTEGQTVTLGGTNFGITDPDSSTFTYTVSGISGGYFQLSSAAGTPVTTFTTADLSGGQVQFVDDGNETAPAFSVTVNDGALDSNTLAATINYTAANDAPVVDSASLTLTEGQTVTLAGTNFGITDPDSSTFTYTVSGISGGYFQLSSAAGTPVTTFTTADLAGGLVQFVDDGNETAPAFSVTVNDGALDSNTLAATINYTAANDAPVVDSASLTLTEGQTVTLAGTNFSITDSDSASFTYTVSGISGGYFQLSSAAGTPVTTFTTADLSGGLVQFVDDGNETAPAFSVTVNDGALDSNTLAATINYTAANDAPVVDSVSLTLTEGQTVTLGGANFGITDPDSSTFTYTVSGISGGYFQLSSAAGTPVTTFTTADLSGGLVQFVDDGNEVSPVFSVTVNDGALDSNTLAATINYTAANDAPVVDSASLTLTEGQTVTLAGSNFGITDPDSSTFTYTVSGVSGGYFQLSSVAGTPVTTFTTADLAGGQVQFVDDGNETAPAFSVTVNDGALDSNTLVATINYTAASDAPVVDSASLTLTEGQTVTLGGTNFNITDSDSASFTYTVSGVSGGYFQLSSAAGTPVTTFTTADLSGGLVQFVDDGNETAPAFSVTVNDGALDSNTLAATINYTAASDAPVVDSASLTLTEGQTVTLGGTNFSITDPDSASFTYTVSGISGGYFQLSSAAGTAVTTFTTADLAGGLVQFVDDGNETAPAFSVTVNDGALDSNTLAATINYTAANDAPVVDSASLTLTEGQTVTLGGANFGITDPDSASFTYTVSGISGGYFQLSSAAGTPVTTFTTADLSGGLVQFVDDGNETAPAFSVTVNDGALDSNTLAATINYTAASDAPVVDSASLTLAEGQTVTLGGTNFSITDSDSASFTYTVSGVSGGYFQLSSAAGTPVTTFTTADLSGGLVQFVDDGNEVSPAFSVTVNDGALDSNTLAATINYTAANDSPVVDSASLTLTEGQTVTLAGTNFGITDPDSASFTYTVSGISGGYFQLSSAAGTPVTTFTTADLSGGLVQFVDDGNETAPAFSVTVNDGALDSNTLAATINYTAANDAPVVDSASLTLTEGQTVTLGGSNFGITDPDSASFTYTVSGISGGYFQLSSAAGTPVTTFTTADLSGGLVQFVDDGNEVSPAFSVTVNDGALDSNTLAATINYTAANDAPVVDSASLTLSEGQTVTLAGANFGITDPDSSTFTYTVSGISGGYFQLSSAAGTPVTTFTTADLSGGLVQFVDDGNETAPAFSVTVNDGALDSNTLAVTINYTAASDAPVVDSASLTLTEGQTVTLGGTNFSITDSDSASFTYTVSGISGGYFQLSSAAGTPVTTFTTADLSGGLVQFVDDGNETAPAFSVTVNDGALDSNTLAATINYTAANDAPVVDLASLSLTEGQTVTLGGSNFGITDPDSASFTYTVSGISGGYFQLSSAAGTPVTTFTTADLAGGLVQFVDDGNEVSPAFSVTVNDGALDSNTLAATINYTAANDAPVADSASLTLTEGQTVTLAGTNFGITDPDSSTFTYTVSGISGGFFQLSGAAGTPVTTFTTADLSGGLVQFVDDGNETAPAFSVRVNDGALDSNTLAATTNYTAANDAPVVDSASLTLTEGQTVTLAGSNFGITDPDSSTFTYTVSGVSGGYFQLSSVAGTPVTTFTTADLAGGQVQFVDDGNETAPAFSVTVNDGALDSNTLAATINYTAANDAPVVDSASLTLTEGQTVTLGGTNFSITDSDSASFTYTVSGISGGYFQLSSAAGTPVTTFTTADLAGGLVQFVDDGNETAPAFSVTVNDGALDSNTLAATINYTAANDAPVVDSASLTLTEGQTVTLGGANFGITDPDSSTFTYTVSGISGGYFQLSSAAGTPVTTFTTADLSGSLVQFVDDGNETAPAFSVTVNDGALDSNTLAATINYTAANDAPVVDSASLTLTEGQTVTLGGANFGISDPDSSTVTYTVSGVSGGYFQLSSAAGTPVTTFTTADLSGGLVQFVDDGNETAPAFSVTVNDGALDSNTLAATINYTAANDAPVVDSASLTLTEGQTVTLGGANFGITDPDSSTVTYTVSGVSGGYFQLSSAAGTPVTTFTTADLAGGLVQFVDDGNETAAAFSVRVNDGALDSNTLAAIINYTGANDAPVVDSASLTLTEGQTVTLGGTNFGITDPDSASFTYTVSGVSGGYFQLSSAAGTPVTTFTTADLAGGLVQFVDDGNETAPAFSVTVNDGALDSNTLAATINYTAANDAPVVDSASLTLTEGQTVTLGGANFGITDPDSSTFTYTVSGVSGGYFQLSSAAGTPVTTFTTADLSGGLIQFVDDGNEVSPAFSVTVNDGALDSNTLAATINYTAANDAPVVDSASLTLTEGQTVTLAGSNFGITDPDSASFTYTVSGVSGGYFQLSSAAGTPVTTFTTADLSGGLVQFVDDGNETAPAFSVTVNDGALDSNTLAATINYTAANDAPVVDSASLTLTEGQTVTLGGANFGITDPDSASFTYTVSGISGGYFQLSSAAGTPVTTFTTADLAGGLVQFVDDGNETAPAFSVTVNDGALDSNTLAATINYTAANDAPVVDSASLTLTEGQTVTLGGTNFGITDPDSSTFTYTVSGISGGYFQLSSAAGTPVTTFTTADLAGGLVQFVDDGNETAPAFSVTVNDGALDSNTLAATINYTAANDAPVVDSASLTLTEGQTVTLAGTNFGITDPDSASFTYTVSGVSGGYFQLSSAAGTPVTTFTTADLSGGLVQFVDDGNETAPAFSVTVNDGALDSNTLAATINYTATNDAPVADSASLTLTEGQTVTLGGTNVGITDPDSSTFTYTVSGISGGYFQLSSAAGTPVTTFTTADLSGGLVQFVDDGNETAPAFSVRVNDGALDSNTLAATINYTAANDAPVVDSASLTLTEGQTVTLGGANFGITDPDSSTFTYTVSGVSGGYFQLSSVAGTPVTTFTTADLAGGLVQFVDDGNETAPAFNVTVNDGALDSNTLAATINYTAANDAPVVDSASLTLTEGQTVTLGGTNFSITDSDSASFTYTVSGISGGYFQLSSAAGTPVTTFTTADLSGGLVQFVDDGNEVSPVFSVTVNDGALDSNTLAATINYTAASDAPVVDSASLTLTEGQTVTLGGTNFSITDSDSASFTYTVSGISGGYFQLSSAAGTPVTTFTTADLSGSLVQFVDDGNETAPAFSVTVNDGALDSNTLAATINYTAANDAPVADSASLTLTEGQAVTLGGTNFGITDPDSASFTYTVSGISGGYFQLSSAVGTPVTTFTTADLSGGLVQFVDDGNETAPAFSMTVNDGALDSNTLAATINYTAANDAPVVDSASLTLTEGQTVTLAGANFGITDPDSASFTYTVSGISGGYFQLSSAGGTPVTTFTTADLSGGLVQFVDDGNETAPAFSVTVNDGALDSNTLAATTNYTAANDAPVVDSASLTLTEGQTVTLGGANFGITDPDSTSFTYTVSGISGGYFQLSSAAGTPVTTFTTADLSGGLVQFVDDGNETAPAFSVRVNDGALDSNTLAAIINYTGANDAPVVDSASLTLTEGQTVTLGGTNFGITDPDSASFTYTVSGISGGYFQLSSAAGAPVTTFTTADLAGGLVQFVDDGNETAPAFRVTVNDGALDSNTLAATINYTGANDAPVVDSASLTLTEGQTVTLGGSNFGITDPDSSTFTYTVSGISGGYFQLSSAAGTAVTTFTTADLSGGLVQFVDDGNETAPAFSVTVNDGALDSNTLAATINYTGANDAPVVDSASLTLSEGQTVTLGGANFGITDPDSASFTYTVSGISGGYFQLSSAAGTPVTTFTTADLSGGLVQFVDDGNETAPAFSVTVNDGALDSNTLAATINYTAANDAPVVDSASLTLTEGQTVTLGGANFGITDPDSASFTYTVSGISGGYFQLSSAAGTPVTTFTTADLSGGLVQFVDDGNETAPAFRVTVNDGALDSNTLAATINYTAASDAPVVDSASLTLTEGQTVTLGGTNFSITDSDSASFTYTVSGVSGGYFQLSSAAGTPVTTFTTADLSGGLVQFVDDGNETAPAFSVTVNDGALDSNTLAATIDYTAANDAPVVDSASLTLTEGQTVTLGGTNFNITDSDSASFTYTVSGISGGYFQLSSAAGTAVTTFTTADLAGGLVQFVDDGNETAPAFSVMVNDGALDSNTLAATINYTAANDAPVVDSASLTLTEGQTVTLGGANFGITDPDSASFTYTVSGVSGGYFQLSSAAGTPVTTFTTADLSGGLVQFVDDGNETAPAFSVTVNDGALDSNTLAATINYTAASDAPVVDSASLTLTEGQTVTLARTNFSITDSDSASFTYTVSGISGGYFQLSSAAGTPVTTFTTADLSGGLVQFVDDGNEAAPTFSVTVNDGISDSNTQSATIIYTPVNDTPVIPPVTLMAIDEDGGERRISSVELLSNAFDEDSINLTVINLRIESGNGEVVGNPDSTWSYTPANDDDTSVSFTFTVTDGASTIESRADLDIRPINDAPTILNSSDVSNVAGEVTVIQGVQIGDSDSTMIKVSITAEYGLLSIDTSAGAVVIGGANGTTSIVLTGTLAQIDAALSAIRYVSTSNSATNDTLTITAQDEDGALVVSVLGIEVNSQQAGNPDSPQDAVDPVPDDAPWPVALDPQPGLPDAIVSSPLSDSESDANRRSDAGRQSMADSRPNAPDSTNLSIQLRDEENQNDSTGYVRIKQVQTHGEAGENSSTSVGDHDLLRDLLNLDIDIQGNGRTGSLPGGASPRSGIFDIDTDSRHVEEEQGGNGIFWIEFVDVAAITFTAGFVWWLTRSGGMLAMLLLGIPTWRHVDLLPVLASGSDDEADEPVSPKDQDLDWDINTDFERTDLSLDVDAMFSSDENFEEQAS